MIDEAIEVRVEQPSDVAAIREVNRRAFAQDQEGEIVDALRARQAALLSLVATAGGRVVGHIMYSPLVVGGIVEGAALGPMAVLPEYQRQGIGSRLVEAGNRTLDEAGCPFVVVLGHAHFYPRFGFGPASAHGVTCEWDVPDDVFLLLVLDHEKTKGMSGLARYRHEFAEADAARSSIHIRRYSVDDAPAVVEAALESVADVQPWLPWCHAGYSIEESRAWLQTRAAAFDEGASFEFAIVSSEGSYLGACGLNQLDRVNKRANLGYWVRSGVTRRGVATAAVRALRDWGFSNTDLIRLEIVVAAGNLASQRVATNAGAVREGTLRRRLVLHGVAHDATIFSFTRPLQPGGEARHLTT